MKRIILFATLFLIYGTCFSQEDAKGSKDHPLFNRMPGYRIVKYDELEFNVLKNFKDNTGKKKSVEGKYYFFNYGVKKGVEPSSGPRVLRNYMNAVTKAGGEVVLEDGCCNVYLKLKKDNRIVWIRVQAYREAGSYQVWIVEESKMKQEYRQDVVPTMQSTCGRAWYRNLARRQRSQPP